MPSCHSKSIWFLYHRFVIFSRNLNINLVINLQDMKELLFPNLWQPSIIVIIISLWQSLSCVCQEVSFGAEGQRLVDRVLHLRGEWESTQFFRRLLLTKSPWCAEVFTRKEQFVVELVMEIKSWRPNITLASTSPPGRTWITWISRNMEAAEAYLWFSFKRETYFWFSFKSEPCVLHFFFPTPKRQSLPPPLSGQGKHCIELIWPFITQ